MLLPRGLGCAGLARPLERGIIQWKACDGGTATRKRAVLRDMRGGSFGRADNFFGAPECAGWRDVRTEGRDTQGQVFTPSVRAGVFDTLPQNG